MVGFGVHGTRVVVAAPVEAARELSERVSSELRAAWHARPIGRRGPANFRRWVGALCLRAALRLDPELDAELREGVESGDD